MTRPPRTLQLVIVCVGLAIYFALYFATQLPSLAGLGVDGGVPRRGSFVLQTLLLSDQVVRSWFGAPPGFSLLDRLPVLLIAAVILAAAASVGSLVIGSLHADRGLSRLETTVLAIAVGFVGLSNYVLLIGLIGQLRHVWLFTVPGTLVLIVAGGRIGLRRRRATASGTATATITREPVPPWFGRRWLWLAAPFVLVTLLGGLLPPVDFDVREYHLEVPKEFFAAGQIGFLPHNVYGNMPLGAEMLALLGMILSGDWWTGALVGKVLIAMFLPLTGLALLAAGQRLFSLPAGMIAAVLYVSIPWMVRVSSLGLVEGVYGFYLFLAIYTMILWTRSDGPDIAHPPFRHVPDDGTDQPRDAHETTPHGVTLLRILEVGFRCTWPFAPRTSAFSRSEKPRICQPCSVRILNGVTHGGKSLSATPTLLLSGLMAGGAMSCKYPAALFVFLPLAAWALFARRRFHWQALALFTFAALLGSGLWFAKNLALTGNPVYPLAYNVFGGEGWSAEKDGKWRAAHDPEDFSAGAAVGRLADVAVRSQWLSPLVMPFAILALWVTCQRRIVLWLWLYFLYVIVTWWLLTHRIDRFWIPALPIVALLAGLGATWTSAALWRRILVPLLVLGLGVCFLLDTSGPGGYNRYFVSYQRLRSDTERVDPWHVYLSAHVPAGHVALLVGDAQAFDLAVPVIYNTVFDDCIFEQAANGRSPEQVHRWFVDHRVSHIYVHWGEIARYRGPGNYGFTDFVQPQRFQTLVQHGVLAPPAPAIKGHPGQVYRVLPEASRTAPWTTTSSPSAAGTIAYASTRGGKM